MRLFKNPWAKTGQFTEYKAEDRAVHRDEDVDVRQLSYRPAFIAICRRTGRVLAEALTVKAALLHVSLNKES